jgi:hypothetical protein
VKLQMSSTSVMSKCVELVHKQEIITLMAHIE